MLYLEIDLLRFFGHLHPLLVHLPIGFILLGGLFFLLEKKTNFAFLKKALPLTFFLSMLSAIVASAMGWLLASNSAYAEQTLFLHRWSGVVLTILTTLAWLWSIDKLGVQRKRLGSGILIACVVMLLITGHFGGQLTHGADYLKNALFKKAEESVFDIPHQPDSINIFVHLIKPVLELRCYNCHNNKTQNGGLDLSSWESLQKGGSSGEVFGADAFSSDLFKRVTLPQNSKKFMPTKGEPMTFGEMAILKWWIDEGASPNVVLSNINQTDEIKSILKTSYNIDVHPKPFVERIQVDALSEVMLNEARSVGWKIEYLGIENFLLEASPQTKEKISSENLEKLASFKDHITWLDLSDCEVSDDQLNKLSDFSNLSRLRLQNNLISDAGLDQLLGLKNLESLNLYNNPISDQGLKKLAALPALKRLYLWQTQVTEEGKAEFKSIRPDVEL